MKILTRFFYDLLIKAGASEGAAKYLNALIFMVIAVVLIVVIDAVLRRILRSISTRIAQQSKTNFDDILIANKTPRNVAHIVPWFLAFEFTPVIFSDFPELEGYIITAIEIFGIVLTLWICLLYTSPSPRDA